MGLLTYNRKRNFKKTSEPEGKQKHSGKQLSFVVQRHKASHLHYDFRLEIDGVLKSWAVPKGPSLNPQDKRLAMMVEDHPFSYKDFAGVIPEGNYGAGIVEIWDQGTYSDIEKSDSAAAEKKLKAGLKAGNLKFRLNGKKLKGEFALVKLRGKQDNAWLLIKHNDEYAVHEPYSSEEDTHANSPINKWLRAQQKPVKARRIKKTKIVKLPGASRKLSHYLAPMLARETDHPFDDDNWIFEIKWDGYRAIAEADGEKVRLYSRNGNTFNASYPAVVEALEKMNIHAILDGEVVVTDEHGRPSFQLLQDYGNNNYPLCYYVFDVLSVNGNSTCDLPLIERKALLKKLLKKNDVVRYADHVKGDGKAFFKLMQQQHMEGMMAKKADSEYHPGKRTDEWLKIKHHRTQEAIIAGFTEPTGSRKYFGSLILGIREKNGKLKYIGHTGTGFDHEMLKEMQQLMNLMIQETSPFAEKVKTNMPVTWIRPQLVCEIKFTEWTKDGRMRHPVFLHLRADKTTKDVHEEDSRPVKAPEDHRKIKNKTVRVKEDASTEVKITNTDKVFWPEEGFTKGDVIRYYKWMASFILPYLKDRPQSLKRNPNGIYDRGFFQKDAADQAPEWVDRIQLYSESAHKDIHYILCNNETTLTYLNNLGCIELNPWHSTTDDLDAPDYLVIDIDPSEKNTFDQVVEAAQVIHSILDKAGADSYCKTSGATGLHIYVPAGKKYTYEQVKDFAQLVCMLAQQQLPGFTTLERNLQKRGNEMIYLDYLQNRRGQTITAPYSLRPRPGAPVSTPLQWREVKPGLDPLDFNINNILKRLKRKGDLFSGILGKGMDIEKYLKKMDKLK